MRCSGFRLLLVLVGLLGASAPTSAQDLTVDGSSMIGDSSAPPSDGTDARIRFVFLGYMPGNPAPVSNFLATLPFNQQTTVQFPLVLQISRGPSISTGKLAFLVGSFLILVLMGLIDGFHTVWDPPCIPQPLVRRVGCCRDASKPCAVSVHRWVGYNTPGCEAAIEGDVTFLDGQPAAGARVHLWSSALASEPSKVRTADASGHYRFIHSNPSFAANNWGLSIGCPPGGIANRVLTATMDPLTPTPPSSIYAEDVALVSGAMTVQDLVLPVAGPDPSIQEACRGWKSRQHSHRQRVPRSNGCESSRRWPSARPRPKLQQHERHGARRVRRRMDDTV